MADRASNDVTALVDVPHSLFPPQVRKLPWRERQVASIIYVRGTSTATDVEAALGYCLTNSSIRTLLRRLVRKGIVRQRRGLEGRAIVYVPGLTTDGAIRKAFVQLADDYFGGSLLLAVIALLNLVKDESDSAALIQAALSGKGKLSPEKRRSINVAA